MYPNPQGPGPFAKRKDPGGGGPPLLQLSQLVVNRNGERDEILCKNMNFCKKVETFWLQLSELQGNPKNRPFSDRIFFGFDSKCFFCIGFLG